MAFLPKTKPENMAVKKIRKDVNRFQRLKMSRRAHTFRFWLKRAIHQGRGLRSVTAMPALGHIPDWCSDLSRNDQIKESEAIKWIINNPDFLRWVWWMVRYSGMVIECGDKWAGDKDWLRRNKLPGRSKATLRVKPVVIDGPIEPRTAMLVTKQGCRGVVEWQLRFCASTHLSPRTFYRLLAELTAEQRVVTPKRHTDVPVWANEPSTQEQARRIFQEMGRCTD